MGTTGDTDYYQLPAPPAGTRFTVRLGQLPADYDLVVYGPGGQILRPESPAAVPLDGVLPDDGFAPSHEVEAISAEPLDDVPVLVLAGREVVGISANRETQEDAVVLVSGGTGTYLIQVSGFNGATSTSPYMLRAELGGVEPPPPTGCTNPRFTPPSPQVARAAPSVPAGTNTLFVVNESQLRALYPTSADTALAAIDGFSAAGYPSAVLRVDSVGAVRSAFDAWNDCVDDVARANAAASAVAAAVDAVRATRPGIEHVILVGGDEAMPFFRLDDRTTVANEAGYAGAFPVPSALQAALARSTFLSDDPYGTTIPVPFFDRQLHVPQLVTARLVEMPAQITAQVDAFEAGQTIAAPTALTTAYDFLSDGGGAVNSSLGMAVPAGGRATLISESWNRDALVDALDPTPSIVSLNAHADHHRFQPAATGSPLFGTDDPALLASISFDGRVVFSMGCHAGLNVVASQNFAPAKPKDWAQTLAEEGARAYVGNTGFGYGDTALVAYSEDLNARFAANLAAGATIGEALRQAKQDFKSELAIVSVYDEKAMGELTLYGMPMARLAGVSVQVASTASTGPVPLSVERPPGRRPHQRCRRSLCRSSATR